MGAVAGDDGPVGDDELPAPESLQHVNFALQPTRLPFSVSAGAGASRSFLTPDFAIQAVDLAPDILLLKWMVGFILAFVVALTWRVFQ